MSNNVPVSGKTPGAKSSLPGRAWRGVCSAWSGYSFIFIFAVIFVIYLISNNGATWNGVMNILRHSGVVGIIALGMGLIVITGGIDLSVGSSLALVGGFSVIIFNQTNSVILTLLFALVFGALCGLVNGLLIGKAKMPAFIVTLSTMLIYRSLAQYFCKTLPSELTGQGSSVYRVYNELSQADTFYTLGNSKPLTIPTVGIFLLLLTVLAVYLATSTKFGKKLYAMGSNDKAARLAGVNVDNLTVLVYMLGGMLVGVGAFLWIAMNASVDPATTGNSYEMYAIAAVVIGGINMAGGRGKILGILFGAMSYTVIDKIIVALRMDSLINDTIKGMILIVAILVQTVGPMIKAKIVTARRRKQANP